MSQASTIARDSEARPFRGRRWARRCGSRARALALAALALLAVLMAVPSQARADGSSEPPGDTERVITIGPQAVVIQNERGQLRMYDDPSQQIPSCKSALACLGGVLAAYGIVAYVAYDNFTVVGFERAQPPRFREPE